MTLEVNMNYPHDLQPCAPLGGGLLEVCTVCNGAEGCLPDQCPGRTMTAMESDAVYGALRDWVLIGPHRIEVARKSIADGWQETPRSVRQRHLRSLAQPTQAPASDADDNIHGWTPPAGQR